MRSLSYGLLLFFVLCFQAPMSAQEWNLQSYILLSSETDFHVSALHPNPDGSVYVSGGFLGTVDFDPGAGVHELYGGELFGETFDFLAHYSSEGELIFAFTVPFGIKDIDRAPDGSIYLFSQLFGTEDVDPGPGEVLRTSGGLLDILVLKLNGDGSYLDSFVLGAESSESAMKIEIDEEGTVYILGEYSDDFDLDPGPGTEMVTIPSSESNYLFFAAYTSTGDLIGGFGLGTHTTQDFEIDSEGNIYIAAYFLDPIDLDPGPGEFMLFTDGGIDGLWAKYDSDLNFLDGAGYDGGIRHVEIDPQDGFCISGRMPDSMDVDLGPGVHMLYSEDEFDVWYACYTSELDLVHARAFESPGICAEEDMLMDGAGNLFLGGYYREEIDFDPDAPGGEHLGEVGRDGYVVGFDPSGAYLFSHAYADNDEQTVWRLSRGDDGSLWVGGVFQGTVDLDLGTDEELVTAPGESLFVARYSNSLSSGLASEELNIPFRVIDNNRLELNLSGTSFDTELRIHSMEGKLILNESLKGGELQQIHLPKTAKGIWLLTLENEEGRFTRKLESIH